MRVDTPRSFVLEVRHFMACKIICDYIFKLVDFGIRSTVDGDTCFLQYKSRIIFVLFFNNDTKMFQERKVLFKKCRTLQVWKGVCLINA